MARTKQSAVYSAALQHADALAAVLMNNPDGTPGLAVFLYDIEVVAKRLREHLRIALEQELGNDK